MKLSILICTIQARQEMFEKLAYFIQKQIKDPTQVELRYLRDGGDLSIGMKRQILLEQAAGKYVCYVDDDDMVADYYVMAMLKALELNPDCVGIKGLLIRKYRCDAQFIHSIQYSGWGEKNGQFYRTPNHLNPIRKSIALQVGFKDISHGEDRAYSDLVYPLLKKEVMIEQPLYYYYPGATREE